LNLGKGCAENYLLAKSGLRSPVCSMPCSSRIHSEAGTGSRSAMTQHYPTTSAAAAVSAMLLTFTHTPY